MSLDLQVSFDVRELKARFPVIASEIDKGTIRALNDAAFQLRQEWIDDVVANTDKPVAFTKRVFVRKADDGNFESRTFFPEQQSKYLSLLLEGGRRRPGDVGTLRRTILLPVNARLNSSGNFPQGPKRWIATVEERIKGAFVIPLQGRSTAGNARSGVFQRLKARLKLLAIFEESVDYPAQLPLDKSVAEMQDKFEKILLDRIEEAIR